MSPLHYSTLAGAGPGIGPVLRSDTRDRRGHRGRLGHPAVSGATRRAGPALRYRPPAAEPAAPRNSSSLDREDDPDARSHLPRASAAHFLSPRTPTGSGIWAAVHAVCERRPTGYSLE